MSSLAFQKLKKTLRPAIHVNYPKTNVLFIHIPKAAGSNISTNIFGYRVGHIPLCDYFLTDKNKFNEAFKFSFARHPFRRFISAYNFLLSGGINLKDKSQGDFIKKNFQSLIDFVDACEDIKFRNKFIHLKSQYNFVSIPSDIPYCIKCDFVGKTEFFNEDIKYIANQINDITIRERLLGLKTSTRSINTRKNHDPNVYDECLYQKIINIYRDDMEIFGYDEWNTLDKLKLI